MPIERKLNKLNFSQLERELQRVSHFRQVIKLSITGTNAGWAIVAASAVASSNLREFLIKSAITVAGVTFNSLVHYGMTKVNHHKIDLIKNVQREKLSQLQTGLPSI